MAFLHKIAKKIRYVNVFVLAGAALFMGVLATTSDTDAEAKSAKEARPARPTSLKLRSPNPMQQNEEIPPTPTSNMSRDDIHKSIEKRMKDEESEKEPSEETQQTDKEAECATSKK
ncbi:hypothetical protein NECID01_0075 [Nematocida sp. AWRm77]|nr:hypothetical protein NECID01_0075 [Nematocida sp. AWRm77]